MWVVSINEYKNFYEALNGAKNCNFMEVNVSKNGIIILKHPI